MIMRKFFTVLLIFFSFSNLIFAKNIQLGSEIILDVPDSHEFILIEEDGSTEGSLGSSDLDLQAIGRALKLMAYGNNEYIVSDNGAEYFIESYTTPPQLVLMGGGHIAKSVAALVEQLQYRLFVMDDREEFSNTEKR